MLFICYIYVDKFRTRFELWGCSLRVSALGFIAVRKWPSAVILSVNDVIAEPGNDGRSKQNCGTIEVELKTVCAFSVSMLPDSSSVDCANGPWGDKMG